MIEQTIRENLPEGFQRAEYLLEHGMIDMVVHRQEMRATLSRVRAAADEPARRRSKAVPMPNGNGERVATRSATRRNAAMHG